MVLGGHRFEVSWQTRKAAIVRRGGVELSRAVRLLDDPRVVLEAQMEPPYVGQYRATGRAPDRRLLALAIEIMYPGGADDAEDVGRIQVFTAWLASAAERASYINEQ